MKTVTESEKRVRVAIDAIARGEFVVVADDENRENEGDLIMAADAVDAAALAFMVRHTSGLICVGITAARADALRLPPMVPVNTEAMGTAFTVSVDYRRGTTTGISAADRAATVRALADPETDPEDLARPGHLFPLRAKAGGVLRRPGHTEAAVDLASLAGREPAGVLCELVNADGTMQRGEQLRAFADEHGLAFVTIADLVAFRRHHERLVTRESAAPIPTPDGTFVAHAYRSTLDEVEHVAFVLGDVAGTDAVLVRVHSECLTGDVLGSLRCDCGLQLAAAREAIAAAGRGVLVYLRGHEGRGIGLGHKLRAYELQDNGYDTVDANLALGLPVDSRDYGIGAQILTDLGVSKVRLMTNNPAKYTGLGDYGITITERVPLIVAPTVHSRRYLETKRDRLHHQLDDPVDDEGESETDPDLTLVDLNPADIEEAS